MLPQQRRRVVAFIFFCTLTILIAGACSFAALSRQQLAYHGSRAYSRCVDDRTRKGRRKSAMLEIQRALLSAQAPDGLLPRDFQRICRLDSSTFTSLCEVALS
jgi:hypothetical protein